MKVFLSVFGAVLSATTLLALTPEILQSVAAIPPHVAGRFRDPKGFQQSASGHYVVFDRRAHIVFGLDENKAAAWPIVHVGPEPGRLIGPTAFSLASDGSFVVADAPDTRDRVQVFGPAGFRTAGFVLPAKTRPRITFNNVVMSGIGSLHYDGASILISVNAPRLTLSCRVQRASCNVPVHGATCECNVLVQRAGCKVQRAGCNVRVQGATRRVQGATGALYPSG